MTLDLHTPTCWKDLTSDQLREVVNQGLMNMPREEFLLALFCKFANVVMVAGKANGDPSPSTVPVKTRFKDKGGHEFELEDWQVVDFCNRLDFAFDEQMPMEVAWPFKWDRYLMDTKFGDWFHADAQMLGFALDGNPERLKGAMKDLGDLPETLEPSDITLLLRWYECFKDYLQLTYPLVFQKAEPGANSPATPIEARQNIMLMLNDGKPQDNERIEQSNMHDVLAALQHKIEQAKEVEHQMKN